MITSQENQELHISEISVFLSRFSSLDFLKFKKILSHSSSLEISGFLSNWKRPWGGNLWLGWKAKSRPSSSLLFSLPRSEKWKRGGGRLGEKKKWFFFLIRCCPSVAPSSSVLRTSIFATEFKLEVEEYCLHFLNMFFQTPKFAFLRAETK